MNDTIFKAYDVRGDYPDELDPYAASLITRAVIDETGAKDVLVGRDVRDASAALRDAVVAAARGRGVRVVDAGIVSTDMVYYGVGAHHFGSGIILSASHLALGSAGMKLVNGRVEPIPGKGALQERVQALIQAGETAVPAACLPDDTIDLLPGYVQHVFSFLDAVPERPARVVCNVHFGTAGRVVDAIADRLPIDLVRLNWEPNPLFPKGQPDPFLSEQQHETSELIRSVGADFGIAFDADADRCIVFDETGNVVRGDHIGAVLAETLLQKEPGGTIIGDVRFYWVVQEAVSAAGGSFMLSRVGHAPIKKLLKENGALFATESSGHYTFRENYFSDNGMVPWLLLYAQWAKRGCVFSELFQHLPLYAASHGEVNFTIEDKRGAVDRVRARYHDATIREIDGVEIIYPNWRCNVRLSNTEPLLRATFEGKTQAIVDEKIAEVKSVIL